VQGEGVGWEGKRHRQRQELVIDVLRDCSFTHFSCSLGFFGGGVNVLHTSGVNIVLWA
jgi:hypothetical protein